MAKKLTAVAQSLFTAINAAPSAREAILASATEEIRAEILAEIERLRPLTDDEREELALLNDALASCEFAGSLSSRSNWVNVVLLAGVVPEYDSVKYEIVFDGSLSFTGVAMSSFKATDGTVVDGGNLGAQDVEISARFEKRGSVQPSTSALKAAQAQLAAETKAAAAKKPVAGLAALKAAALAKATSAKKAAAAL